MLNEKQIEDAADELGCLRFYPSNPGAKLGIMKLLNAMVSTKPQLDWLVSTMINRVGEWKGPKELRGVFCSKFRPADGIEGDCTDTSGFTSGDLEAKYIESHEEQKRLANTKEPLRLAAPDGAETNLTTVAKDLSLELAAERTVRTNSVPQRVTVAEVEHTEALLREILHLPDSAARRNG